MGVKGIIHCNLAVTWIKLLILCAHCMCMHLAPKFIEKYVLSNLPKDITTVCNDELQELKKEDPRYSGKLQS